MLLIFLQIYFSLNKRLLVKPHKNEQLNMNLIHCYTNKGNELVLIPIDKAGFQNVPNIKINVPLLSHVEWIKQAKTDW